MRLGQENLLYQIKNTTEARIACGETMRINCDGMKEHLSRLEESFIILNINTKICQCYMKLWSMRSREDFEGSPRP